jgi:hypothetical protein
MYSVYITMSKSLLNISSDDQVTTKPASIRQSRAVKKKQFEQQDSPVHSLPIDIPKKITEVHHHLADDKGPEVTVITPRKRQPRKQSPPKADRSINRAHSDQPEQVEHLKSPSKPVVEVTVPVVEHDDCSKKRPRSQKICSSCDQKIKKPKEPSVAQLANQERFKQKVIEAKKYQESHPDVSYRQAMQLVAKQ